MISINSGSLDSRSENLSPVSRSWSSSSRRDSGRRGEEKGESPRMTVEAGDGDLGGELICSGKEQGGSVRGTGEYRGPERLDMSLRVSLLLLSKLLFNVDE